MPWTPRPDRWLPTTRVAMDALADREWHPWEAVRSAVARAVPPGQALRFRESYRARLRARNEINRSPQEVSQQQAIAIGQRHIAGNVLRGWVKRGKFEEAWIEGVRHIRLVARTREDEEHGHSKEPSQA